MRLVVRIVALLLHLAVGLLILSTPLLAPVWVAGVYGVIWVVVSLLGVDWWKQGTWKILAAPVVVVLLWWAGLTLGDIYLGWTA